MTLLGVRKLTVAARNGLKEKQEEQRGSAQYTCTGARRHRHPHSTPACVHAHTTHTRVLSQRLPLQDDSSQSPKLLGPHLCGCPQLQPHPCALVSRQHPLPSTSPSSKGSGPSCYFEVWGLTHLPASLVREMTEAFPGVQASLRP